MITAVLPYRRICDNRDRSVSKWNNMFLFLFHVHATVRLPSTTPTTKPTACEEVSLNYRYEEGVIFTITWHHDITTSTVVFQFLFAPLVQSNSWDHPAYWRWVSPHFVSLSRRCIIRKRFHFLFLLLDNKSLNYKNKDCRFRQRPKLPTHFPLKRLYPCRFRRGWAAASSPPPPRLRCTSQCLRTSKC